MKFEWDPEKVKQNFNKHKVHFEEATTVFYDPLSATFSDPDHSSDESRLVTVGFSSQGHLIVVSYAERGKNIRIISARTATANERKRHET